MNGHNHFFANYSPSFQGLGLKNSLGSSAFSRRLLLCGGTLTVSGSDANMVAESEDRKIFILLYGTLYNDSYRSIKNYLLEKYRKLGPDFIKYVNGSFALLIADQEQDRILVFTDRVNSRKVFFSNLNGNMLFSSQLSDQPLHLSSLDTTAAACYMANGSMLNNRTPYQEIRTLARASIYRIKPQKMIAQRYWNYEFTNAYANIPEDKLQLDFGDILVSAVKKRVQDQNLISLSSGYDSSVILGIMGSTLKLQNVQTFSYCHGKVQPDSDEAIAAKMAALYDYPHTMVPSYAGDLANTLTLNGMMGQGISNYCDEVDAWMKLSETFPNQRLPLFVGDQCFGGSKRAYINSDRDALKYASVYSFESQAWQKKFLGKALYHQFCFETSEEIRTLLNDVSSFTNFRDKKDYLFLDFRTNTRVMPWRENFAGRFFDVQNPFLDNEALDFIMAVPGELRRGKQLFRRTAVRMFPDLFEIQRAHQSSSANYWPEQLKVQHLDLERLLSANPSRLDEVIPTEMIQKIIQTVIAGIPSSNNRNLHSTTIKITRKLLGEANKGLFPTSHEAVQSLKRILLLRQYLIDPE
jgi:asparagine synthase (glutamine-hydrolysing)